jgi:aerobic carbon-monoxide dehydrogenase large subunit
MGRSRGGLTSKIMQWSTPTGCQSLRRLDLEVESPLNPIGAKGAGEGGTIPAIACVIAAVED